MTDDESPLPTSLADLAGVREKILDEHMYRLPPSARRRATFRLQLYTAPSLRPVAIATQMPGAGEGASLENVAEICAATVWQHHFPDHPQPPIWIAHMIIDDWRDLALTTFTANPAEHTLRAPEWERITPADLDELIGQPVDLERGSGFTPPTIAPDPQSTWEPMAVVLLPRPRPFREDSCMPAGTPWWRRLARQLAPQRRARDCCWYHGGDWHTVTRLAIRLTTQAKAAGLSFDETATHVLEHPDARELTTWQSEALLSLMTDPIIPNAPWPRRQGYINGQHRAQAMLDAGVRRTLTERIHH